ncbi:hypothetical protein E2C01_023454 [Portunus trituberculatus]|uniref:Uncharacterized protein n=1 Tax=Portunus trituberculatus TaxID=210409 RepID=A0A5B7EBL7_PORTR|nr:hypothetical protein [Portunus trituberculatus]
MFVHVLKLSRRDWRCRRGSRPVFRAPATPVLSPSCSPPDVAKTCRATQPAHSSSRRGSRQSTMIFLIIVQVII